MAFVDIWIIIFSFWSYISVYYKLQMYFVEANKTNKLKNFKNLKSTCLFGVI